ncbi:SRPBCC family protein [Candidatus Viridilinea mediisalina]|uniref:Carbon monoxide dehydrogenase n=1 Tax=Candidatus Viridilinea mediisalina TaxID=2024553 RepID=A0A2A6RLU5_9CHLR|nr:carbon monoxide dehydrogenase subunit G [Candidatus Viridilinea mediisalina]PDW03820.1 hypothetical protein CJ255_06610 [Candidatus Viridilinea mediisalina]
MRIAGNYTFDATREEVWAALNDPEIMAHAILGCQRMELVGDQEYESTLTVDLDAVHGVYHGRVRVYNIVSLESYDIAVDGQGNNGLFKGSGSIKLRSDGAQTILDYGGEAQLGGTLATVGQRLLDAAARTLIHQSLKQLAQLISERRLHHDLYGTEHAVDVPYASMLYSVDINTRTDQRYRSLEPPHHQCISEITLVRGAFVDLFQQKRWLLWLVGAFWLGYLLGQRRKLPFMGRSRPYSPSDKES